MADKSGPDKISKLLIERVALLSQKNTKRKLKANAEALADECDEIVAMATNGLGYTEDLRIEVADAARVGIIELSANWKTADRQMYAISAYEAAQRAATAKLRERRDAATVRAS